MVGEIEETREVVGFGDLRKYFTMDLRAGYIREKCDNCDMDEARVTDLKKPLKLDHIDGDLTNHRLENLRLLCHNCYFLMVG